LEVLEVVAEVHRDAAGGTLLPDRDRGKRCLATAELPRPNRHRRASELERRREERRRRESNQRAAERARARVADIHRLVGGGRAVVVADGPRHRRAALAELVVEVPAGLELPRTSVVLVPGKLEPRTAVRLPRVGKIVAAREEREH